MITVAQFAALLFAVGAVLGGFLAFRHFTGKSRPMPVALLHGAFAAGGLLCLAAAFVHGQLHGTGSVALVIFLIAAAGGFYLFSRHLQDEPLPSRIVIFHGAGAVIAFIVLLSSCLQ